MPRHAAGAGLPPWPAPHPYGTERQWLDCLLEREVLRLRARYELSLDELRGLYVSDRQVDELLRQHAHSLGNDGADGPAARLSGQAAQWRQHFAADSPLELLGTRLGLDGASLELLMVALAPELDLRYETLYAYLNNDITRKLPTLDLAARLLGADGMRARVAALADQGILDPPDGAERRSTLGLGLRLGAPVRGFLLGVPAAKARKGTAAPPDAPQLETVEGAGAGPPAGPAEVLVCRDGDPERLEHWASARLAAGAVHGLHLPAAALDDQTLLLARLAGAALVVHDVGGGAQVGVASGATVAAALTARVPLLWLAPRGWRPDPALAALAPAVLDLPPASLAERGAAWRTALQEQDWCRHEGELNDELDGALDGVLVAGLAARFSFGPARIRQAVAAAGVLRGADPACRDGAAALERSARQLAARPLAQVAQPATRAHGWEQLVLPATTLAVLREVAGAVDCRHQVYREWQMQRRTGRSAGLMMLFSGASGTGKTMAASVLANHVGLELFRVDLAGVISKYIGETEKNLDRIFSAAVDADALLLFDEADALLGKRAEVKDAHDRYANLEVAYLLQKMEDHDGVVILASNLPKNLDQAFSRRMHYVVEFGRPPAPLRERLWRGMFPPELPLAGDLDYAFLAEQFDLTGGDIQTIALEAAFLAASQDAPLGMEQLMRALARRQTKHGDPGAAARLRAHQGSAREGPA